MCGKGLFCDPLGDTPLLRHLSGMTQQGSIPQWVNCDVEKAWLLKSSMMKTFSDVEKMRWTMPHQARKKSETGFYHVVPKGIADQLIFQDGADRELYLKLLAEAKEEYQIILHAYVLMSNHTHLLVQDPNDALGDAMKYVHERYGMYYSGKIGRTGGIFRKPYWSEAIGTDAHFLCAVRYIHANPAAAGICAASSYDYSSAKDYLGRKGIADTGMALDMLGGREGFIEWSQSAKSTFHAFPGSKLTGHLSDSEALVICQAIMRCANTSLVGASADERAMTVRMLNERGLNVSQMARITGLGRSTVQRDLRR